MATRTLTSPDVERLVEWDALLAELERAHRALAVGAAFQPAPHALRDPNDDSADAAAVVPMTSYDAERGLFAIKVLADAPGNRARGLPAQRSTVCVFSAASGECVGVVDGRALTRIRTAAVTALATRTLARPESRTLTLLGSGALAIEHGVAVARVLDLDEIRLWSRSSERSERAAAALRRRGLGAVGMATLDDAVRGADVVCTLTPSSAPILASGLVTPGMHVNAVGSPPRPEFSELDPVMFARAAAVVVDSRAVALADSGNVQRGIASGLLDPADLAELGEVLVGRRAGRTDRDAITIYNSVGIGLQDLAAADHVLQRAAAVDAGTMVMIRE